MIDIYAWHIKLPDGTVKESKTLLQSIPAASQDDIYLVNPKVQCKLGSAESMDFSIMPGTKFYDSFYQMLTYMQVIYDGEVIFYGRVLTIEQGFYGDRKVKCEGALAFFNDSYYPAVSESDIPTRSLKDYITDILNNHNTQVEDGFKAIYPGEIPGQYSDGILPGERYLSPDQRIENKEDELGSTSWAQTKSVLDNLANEYGGMFKVRYDTDPSGGEYLYLDWFKHYYDHNINAQEIKVGKNLLSCSSITEVNNIFTWVIPIGKGSDGTKIMKDGSIYFGVSRDLPNYYTDEELNSGYHRASDYKTAVDRYKHIIKVQEFPEADTQEKLCQQCAEWVKENYQGGIEEFTISALDLYQYNQKDQKILCGDRVHIYYPIDTHKTDDRILTCTAVTYDIYNPENNQYTFGIPAASLKGKSINSKRKKGGDEDGTDKPVTGGGTPEDPYKQWWNDVCKWLNSHTFWNYDKRGAYGPGGHREDWYFLRIAARINGKEAYLVRFATQSGTRPVKINAHVPGGSMGKVINKEVSLWKSYESGEWTGYPYCNEGRILKEEFSRDHLINFRIIEYVWDEYHVNLTTDLAHKMPTTDPNGTEYMLSIIDDAVSGITGSQGTVGKITRFLTGDFGEKVGVIQEVFADGGYDITSLGGVFTTIGQVKNKAGDLVKTGISFLNDKINIGSLFGGGSPSTETPSSGVSITMASATSNGEMNVTGDSTASEDVIAHKGDPEKEISLTGFSREVYNDKKIWGTAVTTVNRYFDENHGGDMYTYKFTQEIEDYKGGQIVTAHIDGDNVVIGSDHAGTVINAALHNVTSVCGEFKVELNPETGEYDVVMKNGTGLVLTRNNTKYGVYDQGSLDAGVIVEKLDTVSETDRVKARTSLGFYDNETLKGGILVEKLNDDSTTTKILGTRLDMRASDWARWGIYTDETLDAGVIVERLKNVSEEERVTARAGLGFYDNDTLEGGILVNKLNNDSYETYVRGDIIQITKTNSYVGGFFDKNYTAFYNNTTDRDDSVNPVTPQPNTFYGDLETDKVFVYENGAFKETAQTLNLSATHMGGAVMNRATVYELNAVDAKVGSLRADIINAKYINADNFNTRMANVTEVNLNNIIVKGAMSFARDATGISIPGNKLELTSAQGQTIVSIKPTDFIKGLQVVSAGTNKYKIQYQLAFDNETTWHDVTGTFERASRLTGSWSGGIFTVSEDPNGSFAPVKTSGLRYFNVANTIARDNINISQIIRLDFFDPTIPDITPYRYSPTGYEATVTIDATSVWNACRGNVSIPTSAIGSNALANLVIGKPKANGASGTDNTTYNGINIVSNFQPSGSTSKIYAAELKEKDTGNVVARYDVNTLCSNIYTNGWNAARSAYKLKGSWSGGVFTVKEDSSGSNAPISSSSLTMETNGSVTRSGTNVTQNVLLKYSSSSGYQNTGFSQDITINAQDVWDAARTAYKLKGTWSNGIFTVSENSSGANAPISSTSLKMEASGSISKSNKSVSRTFKLRWYDATLAPQTSNPYQDTGFNPTITIDATSVWADGNSEGWNSGYDNAAGKVKIDGISTLNTTHNLTYDQSSTVEVPVTYSGTQRTTITHTFTAPSDRYNTGWNDCRNNMVIPIGAIGIYDLTNSLEIKKPKANGSSSTDSTKYSMSVNSSFRPQGQTKDIYVTELKTGSNVVARYDINSVYKAGFKAGFEEGWKKYDGDTAHWDSAYYNEDTGKYEVWCPSPNVTYNDDGTYTSSWADAAWFSYDVYSKSSTLTRRTVYTDSTGTVRNHGMLYWKNSAGGYTPVANSGDFWWYTIPYTSGNVGPLGSSKTVHYND